MAGLPLNFPQHFRAAFSSLFNRRNSLAKIATFRAVGWSGLVSQGYAKKHIVLGPFMTVSA
jgi:hypothetical protein